METLIVWENLDMNRFELRSGTSSETVVKMLTSQQARASACVAQVLGSSAAPEADFEYGRIATDCKGDWLCTQ